MGIPKRLTWLPIAILGVGIAFHALYVFSVITIYFQSPLVFGLSPYRGMPQDAPAHRLVLFVGMSFAQFIEVLKIGSRNRALFWVLASAFLLASFSGLNVTSGAVWRALQTVY